MPSRAIAVSRPFASAIYLHLGVDLLVEFATKQAEQDLWTLTAADQPDAAKIEGKIAEIGKLRGDERLGFIRAVGEASKLLTDEQRKILTGFAPPAPAAAPMAPMKGM